MAQQDQPRRTRDRLSGSIVSGTSGFASDVSPGGPAPGMLLWLRAEDCSAVGSGNQITTWADQSGNGYNATGQGATKPTYQSNVLNGWPTVRFNGTSAYFTIADNAGYKVTKIHLFIVFKSSTTTRAIIQYPQIAGSNTSPYMRWGVFDLGYIDTRVNGVACDLTGLFSSFALWEFAFHDNVPKTTDTASATVINPCRGYFKNGAVYAYASNGASQDVTYPNAVGIYIGANGAGGELLNGDIAEIILYQGQTLTAAQRLRTNTYLKKKYGL